MSVFLSGLRADCKLKTVNPPTNSGPTQPPKLLDQVAGKMRLVHYSKRTESAYVDWIKRFILFHNKRHPRDMGAAEIEGFLTHLAVERTVAASTQNQAFAAILFLYQKVLQIELPNINALRARRPEWLAVVLAVRVARDKREQPPTRRMYYGTHPPECRMPPETIPALTWLPITSSETTPILGAGWIRKP